MGGKNKFIAPQEKREIEKLYADRLKRLGISPTTVGWSSKEQQYLRFKILSEIGDFKNSRICDVGCGLGDLYLYLKELDYDFQYKGLDISSELIEAATKRIPNVNFEAADILEMDSSDKYDWVVLSGALNFKIGDNWSLTTTMLRRMFEMSVKGIACNFLSTYVDFENPINFHHDPKKILDFASTLSRKFVVRHDYPLWEFTLYIYK